MEAAKIETVLARWVETVLGRWAETVLETAVELLNGRRDVLKAGASEAQMESNELYGYGKGAIVS